MPRKVTSIDHPEGVRFIALSGDGTKLVVADGMGARIWKTE